MKRIKVWYKRQTFQSTHTLISQNINHLGQCMLLNMWTTVQNKHIKL